MSMYITVLTPDKQVFEGDITSVKVPGTNGEFQVLKNHAPIVSSLENGKVTIVTSKGAHKIFNEETGSIEEKDLTGETVVFHIEKGFVEVLKNEISLLVQGVQMQMA